MSYRVCFVCNFSTVAGCDSSIPALSAQEASRQRWQQGGFPAATCSALSCLVFFCNTSENRLTLHHTSWFMDIFSLSFFIYFSLYILMKLMNYIVFYCVFPMRHFCRDLSQLAIWCCPNHRSKAYELLTTAGIPEVDAPVPWARKNTGQHPVELSCEPIGDGWMDDILFFGWGGYPEH